MKTTRKMLIAFLLNLGFSVFEFFGGIISGSHAIMSDAFHDFGDALSIGVSLVFEKKSKQPPDEKYTYGYGNYSLIGALFTTLILLSGSVIIIISSASKIINPTEIEYGKMIMFAVIGVIVNTIAAFVTRGRDSANQRAVNLHMLEDVLGWICVLIGAVIMHFTDFYILDPIMSIAVSTFIIFHSMSNLKEIFSVFLGKIPEETDISEIKEHLMLIEGICDVHHVHIRRLDGQNHDASMHITAHGDFPAIKRNIREELREHGIVHVTLELESVEEYCPERQCQMEVQSDAGHHHHHHHGT